MNHVDPSREDLILGMNVPASSVEGGPQPGIHLAPSENETRAMDMIVSVRPNDETTENIEVNDTKWERMAAKQYLAKARNYLKVLQLFIEFMGYEVPMLMRQRETVINVSGNFLLDFSELAQDEELCETLNCIAQLQDYTVNEGIEIPTEGISLDVLVGDNGEPRESLVSRRDVPNVKHQGGVVFANADANNAKSYRKMVRWKDDIQTIMNPMSLNMIGGISVMDDSGRGLSASSFKLVSDVEISTRQIEIEVDEAFDYLKGNDLNEGISAMLIGSSEASIGTNVKVDLNAGRLGDDILWEDFPNVSTLPAIDDNDMFRSGVFMGVHNSPMYKGLDSLGGYGMENDVV